MLQSLKIIWDMVGAQQGLYNLSLIWVPDYNMII